MFAVEASSPCTLWKGVEFRPANPRISSRDGGLLLVCLLASMKAKNVNYCQAHQKSNACRAPKSHWMSIEIFRFFRSAKESSNVNEMDHPSSQIDLISLKNGNCGFHIFQNVISRHDWEYRHVSAAALIDDCPSDECDLLTKLILTAAVGAINSQTFKLSRSGTEQGLKCTTCTCNIVWGVINGQ